MTPLSKLAATLLALGCLAGCDRGREAVDYVNPYVGNVSHILVPAYPTVHLPYSMLRVYPDRKEYACEYVGGLPVIVTNHREKSAFKLWPSSDGLSRSSSRRFNYDNEHITPYGFEVELCDNTIKAAYALSSQSAIYDLEFRDAPNASIALYTSNGVLEYGRKSFSGWQELSPGTRVYVYMETSSQPEAVERIVLDGEGDCVQMSFGRKDRVTLRYGVSFISVEQAMANLRREINTYNREKVAARGRQRWNEVLSSIEVKTDDEEELEKFYSFYYRTFERPICISEDGKYFSAYDHSVHEDDARPFYVDDWLWDTYRASHPLRCITFPEVEEDILASFLRMSIQSGNHWMPTFPEVDGDSRRMNSNHGVAAVADALAMGLAIDTTALFDVCSRGIDEKTLAPWSSSRAGFIDDFYKEHGYIPALAAGEKETDPNVDSFEKRQPVAVTLGTAYDQWCLLRIAKALGFEQEYALRERLALGYREIFNPHTLFFHPKDKNGRWIEDLDYSFCGGLGAREYYGENNGWVYRWDVPHNIADLVSLMGGPENFCAELDRTFSTPLGRPKYRFYAMLPDHTGNVGQFSMANEPSLHIPYLYNYAGRPYKTQKRIRQMLDTWFRNDLMGIPGDEDGGAMSAFVVFSSLGFYPVAPGTAVYNIGSPVFPEALVHLPSGKDFKIVAHNVSSDNKYIRSAKLNGQVWDKPWFTYEDIRDGAELVLEMDSVPNKSWGAQCPPPSLW